MQQPESRHRVLVSLSSGSLLSVQHPATGTPFADTHQSSLRLLDMQSRALFGHLNASRRCFLFMRETSLVAQDAGSQCYRNETQLRA